jgi:hypothetical protein
LAKVDVGLLIALVVEAIFRPNVMHAVLIFLVCDLDFGEGKVRKAVGTHAGSNNGDGALTLPLGHRLFLHLGDLSFDPSNSRLMLFDRMESAAESAHPTRQVYALLLHAATQLLDLAVVLSLDY